MRLCLGKRIALHQLFKLRPGSIGEQRLQHQPVQLDEIRRAGIEFREQLAQMRCRFARLCGIRRRCRRWNGSLWCGHIHDLLQSGNQWFQCRCDLLLRGFNGCCRRFFTDEFFQLACRSLNRLGPDVSGHTFERVGETLGLRRIAFAQSCGNFRNNQTLLLGELAQQFEIQFPISGNAGEAVLRVQPSD